MFTESDQGVSEADDNVLDVVVPQPKFLEVTDDETGVELERVVGNLWRVQLTFYYSGGDMTFRLNSTFNQTVCLQMTAS